MKSNNSDSVEVNISQNNYKNPTNNKSLHIILGESKTKIKFGLLSRILTNIIIFSYISNKINLNFYYIFSNIPLFTISKLEIHRLITNIFVCESLYELIIGIIMTSTIINNYENKDGTIAFFFKLFFNLIISQVILLFLYYILSFFYKIVYIYRINSREFLCVSYLVKHLLTTETKKIYNPFFGELNDRFVIVVFLLMYFFLNYEYRFENIFCLYYGFIICKYNKIFDMIFLSQKHINFIELTDFGKILKISENFVSIHTSNKNNIAKLNMNNKAKYIDNKVATDLNDERIGLKAAHDFENYENGDFVI